MYIRVCQIHWAHPQVAWEWEGLQRAPFQPSSLPRSWKVGERIKTETHWCHLLQHRGVDHFLATLLVTQVEANCSLLRGMCLSHSAHNLCGT